MDSKWHYIVVLVIGLVLFIGFYHSIREVLYKVFIQRMIEDKASPQISIKAFNGSNKAVLLDCREQNEYDVSHIENALYYGFVDQQFSLLDRLNKNDTVIVYCSVGFRSQKVLTDLKEKGFITVLNLQGGIFQWVYDDLPLYRDGQITKNIHAYNKKWAKLLSKGNKIY